MPMESYFDAAAGALQKIRTGQKDNLHKAACIIADAIAGGNSLFAFGASHSFMIAEEMVYRTGGLMLVNPIYPHGMNLSVRPGPATSRFERIPGFGRELLLSSPASAGDVLIIVSTSGRNPVVVDMARAAREEQIKVIGVTSVAYSSAVSSRDSSGLKLPDLCDVVLDNGAPVGDAAVEVPGCPQRIGPLSSLTGIALVNALTVEVVEICLARGIEPPVFMSANLDGGDEYNARLLEQYRDRIHYL
jgi:uncharacterized phosphosugar-binding protein